jgi:hypothetical protein
MGVYYSATPPSVQHEHITQIIPASTYHYFDEEKMGEILREQFGVPANVRPKVRKLAWDGYEFSFSWYSIVTDGD